MWLVYLSLVIQILFGIHAVKTGRPFVWVLVIILFSVFGCLGYVILELLPEWLASPGGIKFKQAIGKKIDPEKSLKAAQKAYERVDTVQNRLNLAEQYGLLQRYGEAKALYARCLVGPHAEDPQVMLGMAKAEFGLNNFEATIDVLDQLKAANPHVKSPEGHLLYARALEGAGRIPEAIHEYQALNGYYSTPEPACRLAQLYQAQNQKNLADELFQSVVKRSASAGKVFNEVNKDWIKLAKREANGRIN
jgi:hypothetical protein